MSVNKGFFRNTAIMFVAMLVVKTLGALLKIPLGNILGGEGMGYFTTAFSIFSPVLAFTCSGIPAIVTQATAGRLSKGEFEDILHLRRSAVILAVFSGILGTAAVYIAAVPFTCYIANSPESLISVLFIAPSVFFCTVTSVYRAYYEGLSDMLPTALSQIIEAVVKAGVGLGLSYYIYEAYVHHFGSEEQALPYAASGAILGVTVSELCGMIYILLRSRKKDFPCKKTGKKIDKEQLIATMKDIAVSSMPLALGAVIANLMSFTDLLTISNCINLSYRFFPEQLAGGLVSLNGTDISDAGNFLYGSYSGMVMSVYMLTAALPGLISRCSLPKLVCTIECNRDRDTVPIKRSAELMLKGTMIVSAPLSLFMTAFSEPVLRILYPVREIEALIGIIPLQILSIGGIAASFAGAVFAVFQAYGDFRTPVSIMLKSSFIKFVLNVAVIMIPNVNINGAAIATAVSNIFAMFYSLYKLKKLYALDLSFARTSIIPLLSASAGSLCAFSLYNTVFSDKGGIASLLFSCGTGGIAYLILLLLGDKGEIGEILNDVMKKISKRACKTDKNVVK